MERQIVEVKESSKSKTNKSKKKIDLQKISKVIVENKDTIEVVASTLGTLINTSSGKTTKKKTSAKRKTTSSKKKASKSNDTVSTLVDLFLNK